MATQDSTLSSLSAIRTKIRRLTRSPSTSQLTNDQIDDYVNTFVLYDFPEFTVDKKFTFFVMPNIDTYSTNTVNEDDPLYNFKNKFLSVQAPIYVGGAEVSLSQSREQFYGRYPKFNHTENIGTGDGATTNFTGTLSSIPVLAGSLTFNSVTVTGEGLALTDTPSYDVATGLQLQTGYLADVSNPGVDGTINYLTGAYEITFLVAPEASESIYAQTYPYATGKPTAVLFEDNQFIFRPVPDKVYRVEADVFQRPTALLDVDDTPELSQWWQYIAYGAAKKVFEDRMDIESIQAIMPEFMRQRSLILQRVVVQQSRERTATIYTEKGVGAYAGKDSF